MTKASDTTTRARAGLKSAHLAIMFSCLVHINSSNALRHHVLFF